MHKLILWFFRNLNNIGQTLSIICSFFIMTTVIYWLETIFNTEWSWLNFVKPPMDVILTFSNNILPFSLNVGDTVLDGKFIVAIIVLMCLMVIIRYVVECIDNLKYAYDDLHIAHKKSVEKQFNTNLANKVIKEERKISEYMILIRTKLKKKFTNSRDKFNIFEQNEMMNSFIFKKTNVKYEVFNDGFLYCFDDFNRIDLVLDTLFKIKNSTAPLDYSICIQAGNNMIQLKKLADLEYFGKIIFCADTLLRYKCNSSHRYGTQSVGVFQQDDKTIEVHEFHEIL